MAEFRDTVDIEATPEVVFAYLTTNDGINAWLGQHAQLDASRGGDFAVSVAGYPVRGVFLDIDAPRRVVVSWGFAGNDELPPGASTVEFRLTPIERGTRLDLHHYDLPEQSLAGHAHGWANFVPRLAVAAAGGDPGVDEWRPLRDETSSSL